MSCPNLEQLLPTLKLLNLLILNCESVCSSLVQEHGVHSLESKVTVFLRHQDVNKMIEALKKHILLGYCYNEVILRFMLLNSGAKCSSIELSNECPKLDRKRGSIQRIKFWLFWYEKD